MAKKNVEKTFKIGAKVTWKSQAGGFTKIKTGKVIGVVMPGAEAADVYYDKFTGNIEASPQFMLHALPRNETSYLVQVERPASAQVIHVYHPRTSQLTETSAQAKGGKVVTKKAARKVKVKTTKAKAKKATKKSKKK